MLLHPLQDNIELRNKHPKYQQHLSPSVSTSSMRIPLCAGSQEEPLHSSSKANSPLLNANRTHLASELKDSRSAWRTGFWIRFPPFGIAALTGVLAWKFFKLQISLADLIPLGTIGSLMVLITSNGKITNTWGYEHQPSLYLSILSIVSNILMASALSQAVCLSFWRKTLTGGSVSTP